MNENNHIVDFSGLSEILYQNDDFISEFSAAAVESFSEFRDSYGKYLLERDETNFRKAGHKIKPVAQMLSLTMILDEYEHAKKLIWEEKPEKELKASKHEHYTVESLTGKQQEAIEEVERIVKSK